MVARIATSCRPTRCATLLQLRVLPVLTAGPSLCLRQDPPPTISHRHGAAFVYAAAREGQPADGHGPQPGVLIQLAGGSLSGNGHSHHHDHDHDDSEPSTLQHAAPEAAQLATQLTGRSECDRIVVFDGNPRLIGSTADIEIHDCSCTTLMGSIVTREIQHGCGLLLVLV